MQSDLSKSTCIDAGTGEISSAAASVLAPAGPHQSAPSLVDLLVLKPRFFTGANRARVRNSLTFRLIAYRVKQWVIADHSLPHAVWIARINKASAKNAPHARLTYSRRSRRNAPIRPAMMATRTNTDP